MGRPSHVRSAIAELVASSARHDWTIDDVVGELDRRGIAADYSSVFRGLCRLADEGVLKRVELGDAKARFERAGAHHEHVRCERCGTVRAIPGCLVEGAVPTVEASTGFAITGHSLLFVGVCNTCSPAS